MVKDQSSRGLYAIQAARKVIQVLSNHGIQCLAVGRLAAYLYGSVFVGREATLVALPKPGVLLTTKDISRILLAIPGNVFSDYGSTMDRLAFKSQGSKSSAKCPVRVIAAHESYHLDPSACGTVIEGIPVIHFNDIILDMAQSILDSQAQGHRFSVRKGPLFYDPWGFFELWPLLSALCAQFGTLSDDESLNETIAILSQPQTEPHLLSHHIPILVDRYRQITGRLPLSAFMDGKDMSQTASDHGGDAPLEVQDGKNVEIGLLDGCDPPGTGNADIQYDQEFMEALSATIGVLHELGLSYGLIGASASHLLCGGEISEIIEVLCFSPDDIMLTKEIVLSQFAALLGFESEVAQDGFWYSVKQSRFKVDITTPHSTGVDRLLGCRLVSTCGFMVFSLNASD